MEKLQTNENLINTSSISISKLQTYVENSVQTLKSEIESTENSLQAVENSLQTVQEDISSLNQEVNNQIIPSDDSSISN